MNIHRIAMMTKKDMSLLTRESFFLFFILMPIIVSLVLAMVLGASDEFIPVIGVEEGDDGISSVLSQNSAVSLREIPSGRSPEEGILSGTYDAAIIDNENPVLMLSAKLQYDEELIVISSVKKAYYDMLGINPAVTVHTVALGEGDYSVEVRIIPFLVIISIMIGGLIISTSLIEEREQKTLSAVLVTPMSPFEVILSKSVFGLFIGLVLGVLILALNNALTNALILLFLILGTIFTVALGLIGGAVMDNITDLVARMKMFQLFLQFPSFVILFPQIPQWIGKLFPTYYIVEPVLSISQAGASIGDVWWKALVLVACDIITIAIASKVLAKRMSGFEILH